MTATSSPERENIITVGLKRTLMTVLTLQQFCLISLDIEFIQVKISLWYRQSVDLPSHELRLVGIGRGTNFEFHRVSNLYKQSIMR